MLVSLPRLSVRVAQVVVSILALVLAPRSYSSSGFQLDAKTTATIYFTNYAALLCALYYVVALRLFKLTSTPPTPRNQRLADVVLAAVLVLGASLELTNDIIPNCSIREAYFEKRDNPIFRCGMQSVTIVVTYVNAALFVVAAAWSFVRDSAASSANLATADELSAGDRYAAIATPVKATAETIAMAARHPALPYVSRGARAVQLAASIISMVVILLSYKLYESGTVTSMPMFSVMAGYTSALYALWRLVAVETVKLTTAPSVSVERIVDAILAVFVAVGAVLLSTSSDVQSCASNSACSHLTAGYIFLFVAFACHVGSVGLSFSVVEEASASRDSSSTYTEPLQGPDSAAGNQASMV
jgi:hypothetical protein